MRNAFITALVLSFITLVACGGGKGDSCDEEGKVGGECDDGFVCGKSKADGTGDLICLTRCDTALNCSAGEDCNGVGKTSLKGCRPR